MEKMQLIFSPEQTFSEQKFAQKGSLWYNACKEVKDLNKKREKNKIRPRQQEILEFIKNNIEEKGYPPSVREIGKAVGLKSPATVHAHLERLQELGYIQKNPAQPRTIGIIREKYPQQKETVYQGESMEKLPLVGTITAGQPILAQENIERHITLPQELISGSGEHFVLRVQGKNMIEAGINPGDLAIIRHQQNAENGDIVAALIGDEATLKRFFRQEDTICLNPENSSMEPIYCRDVVILGKLISIFRKY